MLNIEIVREFIYEHFTQITESKNGHHFHCRCPLCGDSKKSKSKKRFHLDYNGGNSIYHCWNCGESGSFLQIYSILKGISINDAKQALYKYNSNDIIQVLSRKKRDKVINEIEHDNFNYILKDCISISDTTEGHIQSKYKQYLLDFIKNRCLSKKVKLYVAYKGKFQSRIIIPIYDKYDNIIYFQARRLFKEMTKKYDNPTLEKGSIILNEYKFDKNKYIIVTEGLIDALNIGDNGTSVLGKEITESFLKKILKLTEKGVIIALDNDKVGLDSMKLFMKNNKYKKVVEYFLFPKNHNKYKDINSYVQEHQQNTSTNETYKFVVNNSHSFTATYMKLRL
jgi:DNA primase